VAFERGKGVAEAQFSVGINIVLSGSKNMSEETINELLPTEKVHITIRGLNDAGDGLTLVDEVVDVREFSSGNVGFGLHSKGHRFSAKAE
jgi:hypothetical protein